MSRDFKTESHVSDASGLISEILHFSARRAAAAFALIVGASVLEGLSLASFVPVFLLVTDGGVARSGLFAAHYRSAMADMSITTQIVVLLGAITILLVLRTLVIVWRDFVLAKFQYDFVDQQRIALVRALALADWQALTNLRHARIVNALESDIAQISTATFLLVQIVVSVSILASQTVLTVLIAPYLALFAIAVLAIGAVLLGPTLRNSNALGQGLLVDQLSGVNAVGQFLAGIKVARVQNSQNAFADEYRAIVLQMTANRVAYAARQNRVKIAIGLGTIAGGVGLLAFGYWIGMQTALLIASVAVISRMGTPAAAVVGNLQRLFSALPAMGSLNALRATLGVQPHVAEAAKLPIAAGGAICFERVSFRYPAQDGAASEGVSDIAFDIPPGSFVALVGPSGAGKTTLLDLLSGLLRPDAGTIRIGDDALSPERIAAWQDRISYVTQDPFLLNDTIRRNLTWAAPHVDDAALWESLAIAEAADLVAGLPDGLDTVVAERGMRFSGGERQRLSLARALVRHPRLLILDEATSGIDLATERTIMTRLRALPQRPTVIMVTHRTEQLDACDLVLTVSGGRLER